MTVGKKDDSQFKKKKLVSPQDYFALTHSLSGENNISTYLKI